MIQLAINKDIFLLNDLTLTQKAKVIEIFNQYENILDFKHDLIKLIEKDLLTHRIKIRK